MTWRVAETFVGGPARPSLLELHAGGEGLAACRWSAIGCWSAATAWACQIVLDQGNVNPRHARIFRDDQCPSAHRRHRLA